MSTNWREINVNIGSVVESTKQVITFNKIPNNKIPTHFNSSCGCSKPTYRDNTLTVYYTPGKVPHHVRDRGYQNARKFIRVTYQDNTEETLFFEAKILTK